MTLRYEEFRREYTAGGLTREMLDASPLRQFDIWLDQSVQAGLDDPTAMVLPDADAMMDEPSRVTFHEV